MVGLREITVNSITDTEMNFILYFSHQFFDPCTQFVLNKCKKEEEEAKPKTTPI